MTHPAGSLVLGLLACTPCTASGQFPKAERSQLLATTPGPGRARGSAPGRGLRDESAPARATSLPGATDPVSPTGRRQIVIDLANQQVQGTLPFDVEFDFTGTLPTDAKRLVVEWRDVTEALKSTTVKACQKTARDATKGRPRDDQRRAIEQCTAATLRGDTVTWSTEQRRVWQATGLATGNDLKFLITIPALDAERSFVFRFTLERSVSPDRQAAYRAALIPELRALFAAYEGRTLTLAAVDSLRARARAVLEKQLGHYEVLAEDPVFHPGVPADRVLVAFAEMVNRPILEAQSDREVALPTFANVARELADTLTAVQAYTPLHRALKAFRSEAYLAKLVTAHAPAADLATLDPDDIARLARGREPGPAALELSGAVTAAAADGFTTRYQQLRERLVDLRRFLREALDRDGPYADLITKLTRAGSLTVTDVRALRFLIADEGTVADAISAVDEALTSVAQVREDLLSIEQGLNALAASIGINLQNVVVVSANTIGDFNTFHGYYVSADAGLLYVFGINTVAPYVGTNIYFRPVNKDAPLSVRGGLGRRLSLTLGLTVRSIADDAKTRDNLFGSQAGVVGLGLRVRQSIRLAGGALIFKKKSTSLLRTDQSLTANPYVAMSFDIDVSGIPSALGGLFSK